MMVWLNRGDAPSDELGRDMVVANALQSLDPADHDPQYWLRFRSWVMTEAVDELARRRMMVELTVGDVLASWSRALVPTALAAAIAAVALTSGQPAQEAVGVEELLVEEVPAETQPVLLSPDAAAGIVAFASDIY